MCTGMSNNIIFTVNFKFKLITFTLFILSLCFSKTFESMVVLFLITSFLIWRTGIYKLSKKIPVLLLVMLILFFLNEFSFQFNIIWLFKIYFVILYFKYLEYINSDIEVLEVLKKMYNEKFAGFIYKIKLFVMNIKKYFNINKNLHGKLRIINSVYLSIKNIDVNYEKITILNNNRMYKNIKRKVLIYDFLFVFMHIILFAFCILSEVYL